MITSFTAVHKFLKGEGARGILEITHVEELEDSTPSIFSSFLRSFNLAFHDRSHFFPVNFHERHSFLGGQGLTNLRQEITFGGLGLI